MAIQWYVQHGGKQYGPMTSANLKKLAVDGKISPTTSVRSGAEGAWVPASRVQGLFASSPAPPAAKPTAAGPDLARVAAPPIAPPPAPPMARALSLDPLARAAVAPLPKAVVAPPASSMSAKILGAVALILGILALATCWLPLLPGLIGWTGLVVGGLGLLLGIGGLVLSAMHKGSGLALGIAGSSSSLVGLVLTAVLLFYDFNPKPAPIVLPPVAAAPTPIAAPPPAAEPEPEPEIVWTDASESIAQGPIKATIASARIEPVILEGNDPSRLKRQKPQPMLKVRVTIENTTADKIVEFAGWVGGGDLVGAGLSNLLGGEAGKALASATASTTLADNVGNKYPQTPMMSIFGAGLNLGKDNSIRPGKSAEGELVFPPPLETIEYLRLELAGTAFGSSEPLRFQIPRAFIGGMTQRPTAAQPADTPSGADTSAEPEAQ